MSLGGLLLPELLAGGVRAASPRVPPASGGPGDRPSPAAVRRGGSSRSARPANVVRAPWRLIFVVVTALAGFGVALVHFDAPPPECAAPGRPSSSYAASVADGVSTKSGVIRLTITHDGSPVGPARVCVAVRRADKPWVSVSGQGRKVVSSGVHEVAVRFKSAGRWVGRVVVFDEGADPVAVPISLTVTQSAVR